LLRNCASAQRLLLKRPTNQLNERQLRHAGDTIAKIAERLGIPAPELARLNKHSEGSRVRKGHDDLLARIIIGHTEW
jgi:hypothetical protein